MDFGFTRVTATSQGTTSFVASELLSTKFGLDKGIPSKEPDVYALGITVYQVLTGKQPFFTMMERSRRRRSRVEVLPSRMMRTELGRRQVCGIS